MQVAILGTGLIGGSVGLAARAAGHATVGWDLDPSTADRALAVGAVERVASTASDATANAEVVVVAAPVEGTLRLLCDFPPAPRARLIFDVASVKVPIVEATTGLASFVASHPLAGSERSGPQAAQADLFRDRVWAYVPPRDDAVEARAREFFAALGARPLGIDAVHHDRIVAFTSHLPQVVSTALGSLLEERAADPLVVALCGSGMRSMTRLARSDWSMWRGVFAANSAGLAQEVRALTDILRSVAETLEAGNESPLGPLFAQADRGAAALDRTTGAAPFVSSEHSFGHTERYDDSR